MADNDILIRLANHSDIDRMVNLSYKKRLAYEKAQPKFWKHSERAEMEQKKWFEELLSKNEFLILVAVLKSKISGFIIGQIVKSPEVYNPGGLTLMIDDFCVEGPITWPTVGLKLMSEIKTLSKNRGVVQVVVVSGSHDNLKREFLKNMRLSCVSEWYVGDNN